MELKERKEKEEIARKKGRFPDPGISKEQNLYRRLRGLIFVVRHYSLYTLLRFVSRANWLVEYDIRAKWVRSQHYCTIFAVYSRGEGKGKARTGDGNGG